MTDHIDTGGGAAIGGSLDLHSGTFIGRDQIVVISGYTGEQLELVLARLQEILASGRADLQADLTAERLTIRAPDAPRIILSSQAAGALKAVAAHQSSERAYLTALRVNPQFGRWASQFVPLAASLTVIERPAGWVEVRPEYVLAEMLGEGANRQLRRTRVEDVTEAMGRHPALVLLGAPGSGKTTTLRKLALDAADARLTSATGKLPFVVSLADYHRSIASPYAFLQARWAEALGSQDLRERLHQGDLCLLLDALNEMPFDDPRDYRERVGAWQRFIGDWPGNLIVVTCRSRDYSEPLGLPQVEIEALDDPRVEDFLLKYLAPVSPALAGQTWQQLRADPLLELVRNPYYLEMLAFNVACGGTWPANRAQLFEQFVKVVLQREEKHNHPDWPGSQPLQRALAGLAEAIQPLGEGTKQPRREFADRVPPQVPGADGPVSTPAGVVLRLGRAALLLDTEMAGDEEIFKFYHHQLQEYFAAQALVERFRAGEDLGDRWRAPRRVADMPDPGPLGDFEPLPPPPPTGWEEPTILAAGLVPDLVAFVAAVQAVNPTLAARGLSESGLAPPTALVETVQKGLLSELGSPQVHLRARLAAGEALGRLGDPRFRAVAVDGQRVLLPPLVHIPAGTWQIGSSGWEVWQLTRQKFPAEDERPRHPVELAEYWVGQYPVTNAEWACFMAAGGYQDAAHWETAEAQAWLRGEEAESGAVKETMDTWRAIRQDPTIMQRLGWTSRDISNWSGWIQLDEEEFRAMVVREYGNRRRDQPHYWDDARFDNPSQPVVGITWFEARAYCHWLDGVLRRAQTEGLLLADTLPAGYAVRLLTEAQWERAARGSRGWKYPWGNGWDMGKANTFEGHVLRTNAVGAYPQGVSAEGVHDLSGNVWEWTLSRYQAYPIRANDGRNDPEGETRRVVRGGSWLSYRRYARAACRRRLAPGVFINLLGLRVVVSLSSEF